MMPVVCGSMSTLLTDESANTVLNITSLGFSKAFGKRFKKSINHILFYPYRGKSFLLIWREVEREKACSTEL